MNDVFAWRRLGLLLRNDAVSGYRTLLLQAAVVAAIIIVGTWVNRYFNGGPWAGDSPAVMLGLLLFVWGPIAASGAFRELNDKHRSEAYLLLPASAVEKTIERLLLVTVGFLAFALLFLTLVSVVAEGGNRLLFRAGEPFFRPWDSGLGQLVGHYVVAQSIFFLGAAWFRKRHFSKTVLALAVVLLAYAGLGALLGWVLFRPLYLDGRWAGDAGFIDLSGLSVAAKAAYYYVLPPFCWIVAWMRVRETQVSHAV